MKKYFLLIICICLAVFVNAQRPPTEKSIFEYRDSLRSVLTRNDAWGDTIYLGNTKNNTPVYAYYYNRGGTDSAFVMAGVHGSEFLGVDVANKVKQWLDAKKDSTISFRWKLVVLPSLFVDRVNAAAKDSLRKDNYMRCACIHSLCEKFITKNGCIDPNRQMPMAGVPFKPATNGVEASKSKLGTDIEIENQYLLQLVQDFRPSRIASVHCKNEKTKEEIGIYADPRTDNNRKALGFATDAMLAIKMAFTVRENKGRVLGNFFLKDDIGLNSGNISEKFTALYPQDDKIANKDLPQKRSYEADGNTHGVSFGTWASTEIKEGGKLVKQAATMITIEMPHYYSFFPDKNTNDPFGIQRLNTNIKAYTSALTDVFLSEK